MSGTISVGPAKRAAESLRLLTVVRVGLLGVVALGDLTGCTPVTAPDPDPDPPGSFEVHRIFSTGDHFPGANWNDPHVLHDGTRFIMYASAARNFDENVRIFRLTSSDALTWTLDPTEPVLERGEPGSWDAGSVETPAVVRFGERYHLFYTGYPGSHGDVTSYRIGHAVSDDGIAWTRTGVVLAPSAPDAPPNLDFRQFVVGEPAPLVEGDSLVLYFTAVGANEGVGTILQVIGRMAATEVDGALVWGEPVSVLEPDTRLHPRARYVGYSTPHAVREGDAVHLYFSVVEDNPWRQVAVHRAVSVDGRGGWVLDEAPLLRREDHPWTQQEVRSPAVVFVEGRRHLFFAGHTGLDLAIGVALDPVEAP